VLALCLERALELVALRPEPALQLLALRLERSRIVRAGFVLRPHAEDQREEADAGCDDRRDDRRVHKRNLIQLAASRRQPAVVLRAPAGS
jgi:hypothetical protein